MPAAREVDHLLIGGGMAAASCAETLRAEGASGSIMVVGREPDAPYERPPLSKDFLRGDSSRDDALLQPEGWWESSSIELRTGTSVMKLDLEERVATLSAGKEEVRFGQALLATGANVRRLRAEGADLDGIHYLRAFGNADAIRAEAEEAAKVVLIGGSWIGCEVAASLVAGLGCECTVLMQEEVTFERQFGADVGGFFQGVLADRGVRFHGGDELERFEAGAGGERVGRVVTAGGLELDCDMVVVGAGVMPDVMLARRAGLELGESGGVACGPALESSVPGVYAAGDVCEYESRVHGRRLRVEHFEVAAEQGRTVARAMLGQDVAHEAVPYFFSDLADWASMEYVGPGSGDPVIRGSLDGGDFTAFYVDGERVTAALTVGRSDDLDHARRWIREGGAPDRAVLSDEGSDLGPATL